ncbi:tail sheath [Burkholderia phage BcepB1A]|uniref:tail sheath n=1 Tax=Burkholderia phage BcepB1A TaxID=279530 RepID=UPI000037798E|nr:tail sheath [Burkholderia phage BcepB1A]AAT37723.1 gp17 [Burkholderia phage BcepB1A]
MPISFDKYVAITSGVAAQQQIAARSFAIRVYTPNPMVSVDRLITATSAADVGAYFGTASEEYKRAVKNFGFISKKTRRPTSIQFARWQREAGPVAIYGGAKKAAALATLQAVTAGAISFLFGGATTVTVSGISFSAATSLADVASELQTALRANADANLATCTVSYDPVGARFNFAGSPSDDTVQESISIVPQSNPAIDVAQLLGWNSAQGASYIAASPVVSPVDTLIASVAGNNNFGSILFTKNGGTGITLSDAEAIALQNQSYNVAYKFQVGVDDTTYSSWQAALAAIGGVNMIYSPVALAAEYHDMQDGIIEAATDFTQQGGATGYMYVQFNNQTPAVNDDTLSGILDDLNINYYGQTQVNGTNLSFYQDGVMMGGPTDPRDSNVYANEQWLKSYAGASFMSLQLAQGKIPANIEGRGLLLGKMTKDIIPAAKLNGTFSIGKTLTVDQQLFVTELTGDDTAWQKVQNLGYWYDVQISSFVDTGGTTKYQAVYSLVYSKDDLIRKVVGTHTLI